MFLLYLVSAHPIVTAIILPAYVIVLNLYYLFWKITKKYGFRLPPFIFSLVMLNIPAFFLAKYLRTMLISIIKLL